MFPLRYGHPETGSGCQVRQPFENRTFFEYKTHIKQLYKCCISSPRTISIAHLNPLLDSQPRPIKLVVFKCPYYYEKSHLGVCLALRCFQRLSRPDVATQRMLLAEQLVHQRSVHPGPLVLRTTPLKFLTCAVDRDRTGSRRSEPSSRAALIRELRNPWDLVQPQDATSRHRGAKPCRRCERSGKISLLSPG